MKLILAGLGCVGWVGWVCWPRFAVPCMLGRVCLLGYVYSDLSHMFGLICLVGSYGFVFRVWVCWVKFTWKILLGIVGFAWSQACMGSVRFFEFWA